MPGAAHQRADCLDGLTTASTVASGHTDPADWAGLTPKDPDRPRPLVPCHRSAPTALEGWLDGGHRPPASRTVAGPAGATPVELLTHCPLGG